MEIIDIDLDSIPLSSNTSGPVIGNNFGSGIELLMNDKKKTSSGTTKIDLEDIKTLEQDLNDLSGKTPESDSKQISGLGFSNLFPSMPSMPSFTEKTEAPIAAKTWDGFTKVGEEIPQAKHSQSTNMTEREKRRKKRFMIKKLEEWQSKGTIKSHSHFDMDSNYDEIEDEYEGALEDKRKKDSIKLQGWWFTTVINTLEYGNALLNPFDLNLDGWGEQVSEDLDSYEEIFSELHDKYKGGKMAPEVSLLLRIGFSAAVVNMSNKMLSSATPGFNDVMKQNPELMRMFTNAAVNTMSQNNSAFDFAKTMMNPPEAVNTKFGPPPAPVETKTQAPPPSRPGNMMFTPSRPDLKAATPMFREQGVELNDSYQLNTPVFKRPEMKGPQSTDLDELLSGLKTKQPEKQPDMIVDDISITAGNDSFISLSSLKDIEHSNMPKRSRKRQNKSDKNTVSLDI